MGRRSLTAIMVFALGFGTLFTAPAALALDRPEITFQAFQFPRDKIPRIDGDASDWSMVPGLDAPETLRLLLTRRGTAVHVEWAPEDGGSFQALRLAYFPASDPVLIGPMCCSPQRAGFEARFDAFRVGPPIEPSGEEGAANS